MTHGIEKLLERLDRVKQSAPGRWLARCPAHEDRSPSLSIRQLDDGRILLHDFGGCATEPILEAVAMSMSDLFPGGARGQHFVPSHSRIPARDLLELIDHEALVVALIGQEVLEHRELPAAEWQRLAAAVQRIGRARDHAR